MRHGLDVADWPQDVWIKVDTGLNRIGVPHAEASDFIRAVAANPKAVQITRYPATNSQLETTRSSAPRSRRRRCTNANVNTIGTIDGNIIALIITTHETT